MGIWFEQVTIEKLSLSESFQNIEVSVVAMLFNFLLLLIVEGQRIRQKQEPMVFSFVLGAILFANAMTCLYVFLAYADIGTGDAVICILQALTLMCNTIVSYMFAAYVLYFLNRSLRENTKMPLVNRVVVVLEAVLLTGWLIFAVPYIQRTGALIRPAGLFYILIAFVVQVWHMVYALILVFQKRELLGGRAQITVFATFFLTIGAVMLQAVIGRAPVINYLGATFGMFVFYFNVETPDYIRLTETMRELEDAKKESDIASESKSSFLANMSHEIRTPINAVLGMNELILRESKDETVLGYAGNIERAGNNLLAIINDILDYSRIESGRLELNEQPYNLSSVINDVYSMILFRAAGKQLEVGIRVDPQIPDALLGDEVRIRQIITNLMNNAVKYTNEGKVALEVSMETSKDPASETAGAPQDEVIVLIVRVRDTGIGIRKEDLEKLFRKFERFDMKRNNSIEGAGLGLAITNNLVDLMGGTIEVESAYGEGSVFTVRIPQPVVNPVPIGNFEDAFRRSASARTDYRPSFVAPAARLLVVDDSDMNLIVAKKMLEPTLVAIDTAMSGLKALAMTQDTPYDIIFLDQRMPGMDGEETLRHIRNQAGGVNGRTPVICLTADAVGDARGRYVQKGFTDYLSKPVDGEAIEQIVRQYLPAEKISEEVPEEVPSAQHDTVRGEDGRGKKDVPKLTEKAMRSLYGKDSSLSFRNALNNCVDTETLQEVILEFCREAPGMIAEIEAFLKEDQIRDYTVRIHRVKSSSRTIGAMQLSEDARFLEECGERNDTDAIREKTPQLIEDYRALCAFFEKELKLSDALDREETRS
ncbi:MAG: response regulator [Lachnospiraceae bacterium]|nr:response regulator [Lachnospiraceae bacterium]